MNCKRKSPKTVTTAKLHPDKKPRIFTAEDEAMLDSNIGKALTKAIKQNTKETEKIHPEMSLEIDLGLDSLSRAEVFAALEQNFNIEFDSDKAANALTVGEVIKLTQEYTGSADAEIVATDFDWGDIVRNAGANGNIPEIQAILDKSAFSTLVVNVFFKFAYSVFKLLLNLEVSGNEELKNIKRPFLICPNHQSFLDPFVVVSTFDSETLKHSFAVGATDFFQSSFMLSIARLLNTIPIDPDAQLMKAMKAGAVGLKHGKILNIFPEGERGFDGNLSNFQKRRGDSGNRTRNADCSGRSRRFIQSLGAKIYQNQSVESKSSIRQTFLSERCGRRKYGKRS